MKPFFFKKPVPTKATPAPIPVGATPPKAQASSEESGTTPPPQSTPSKEGSAVADRAKVKRQSVSMDRRFSVSDIVFGSSEDFGGEAPTALEFVLKSFLGQWLAQADAKLREFTQSTVSAERGERGFADSCAGVSDGD